MLEGYYKKQKNRKSQESTYRLCRRHLANTKNIAREGFTLPKILELKENETEVWSRVR